jgi:magnesium chelatase subunit D
LRIEIAKRCQSAGVDGLRADIVMYRAALANAAWRNGDTVSMTDIEAVQALVLAHRRKAGQARDNSNNNTDDNSDADSGSGSDSDSQDVDQNQDQKTEQQSSSSPLEDSSNSPDRQATKGKQRNSGGFSRPSEKPTKNTSTTDADWGTLQAPQRVRAQYDQTEQQIHDTQAQINDLFADQEKNQSSGRSQAKQASSAKRAGLYQSSAIDSALVSDEKQKKDLSINWFSTILHSVNKWPSLQFKYQQKQKRTQILHLILLDTSASTLVEQLSAKAKAFVLHISKHAYLQRENIQILGFGNSDVQQILAKVRAPKELRDILDNVEVAGGTPMRVVLEQAQKILNSKTEYLASQVRCYLITDGRSKAQVSDINLNVPTVLIDTENSTIKRGRGMQIAQQLNAQYFSLA